MEIKKMYDLPISNNVTKTAKPVTFSYDNINTPKKSENSKDTVNISAEASFKSKLNSEVKSYASLASDFSSTSSARIESLKKAYSNDACPVSSIDIARAMSRSVCGYNI